MKGSISNDPCPELRTGESDDDYNDPMIRDEVARWLLLNAVGWADDDVGTGNAPVAVEGVADEGPWPVSVRWLDDQTTGADSIRGFLGGVSLDGLEVLRVLRVRAKREESIAALLTAADLGRYCGYDHDAPVCPMPLPCWHHRRNSILAGGSL